MQNRIDNTKIFTEEPEKELWRSLLQYSYKANIQRYYEERHIIGEAEGECTDIDLLSNSVAGALLQADEYYKASKTVSLQVEPLLLYYGTTNLLYALYILTTGKIPNINNHGMHFSANRSYKYIADSEIKFDHAKDGGIHQYAKCLGFSVDLCRYPKWKLFDFFDSIAEIRDDFDRCYMNKKSKVVLLEVVDTPDGVVEKIFVGEDDIQNVINNIEGFSSAYLKPQMAHNQNSQQYYVLRHKMNGTNIQQLSYSGQPYLQVAHEYDSRLLTIPKELNMYVSLFALGNICRYHPEIWNPFVTQDSTGEKLLIEKLLYYSRRMLPNIVLNRLLNKNISFVSDKYIPESRIHLVGEHEVKEIVRAEVQSQIWREQATNLMDGSRR